MRENRPYGSEGGVPHFNAISLPLSLVAVAFRVGLLSYDAEAIIHRRFDTRSHLFKRV
jgi:hypothetical protein